MKLRSADYDSSERWNIDLRVNLIRRIPRVEIWFRSKQKSWNCWKSWESIQWFNSLNWAELKDSIHRDELKFPSLITHSATVRQHIFIGMLMWWGGGEEGGYILIGYRSVAQLSTVCIVPTISRDVDHHIPL
jgi:hypothetical protein